MTSQPAGVIPPLLLPTRLRVSREYAGLDQATVAERIGVRRQSISEWERGSATPRRSHLIAFAFITGVSLHWLEHGEAPHPAGPDEGLSYTARDSNPEPADSGSATVYHLIPRMRYTDDDERHTA